MGVLLGKVWGDTELVLSTPLISISRLNIKPHARCSTHCHKYKWNAFIVLSGRLQIEVEKNDYPLLDVTEIGPGQLTTVRPGEYHRFLSLDEPVVAFEIYYPETLSEDIVRRDCGALLNEPAGAEAAAKSAGAAIANR